MRSGSFPFRNFFHENKRPFIFGRYTFVCRSLIENFFVTLAEFRNGSFACGYRNLVARLGVDAVTRVLILEFESGEA